MSRTNFHGPEDVRAIEVRLYYDTIRYMDTSLYGKCDWHETFAEEVTVSQKLHKSIVFYYNTSKTCFGYLLESPHRGDSNKYPKHILFSMRK